jgi:plasmid rolling circle replication initiator protein Rep
MLFSKLLYNYNDVAGKKNNKIKIDSYSQNLSPPVNPFNRDISHILQKDEYRRRVGQVTPYILKKIKYPY